jgi:hypothetical protein
LDHFANTLRPGSNDAGKFDLEMPRRDELKQWLREDFRDLNEIMVHVCDYHYFYNARNNLYLGLLWESWATVPSVLSEIDHYVFRSLVAVATQERGPQQARFQLAVSILAQNLENLLIRKPDNPVVKSALDFLRDSKNHHPLQLKFVPALYLAEVTLRFFVSHRIHAALVQNDNNVERIHGEYVYRMETGEFPGFDIASPVGFLADRLRRSLADEDSGYGEEHATAWVLLACASVTESNLEALDREHK